MLLQQGWTALHAAVYGGHTDVVQVLVARYPSMIAKTDIVSEQLNYRVCL